MASKDIRNFFKPLAKASNTKSPSNQINKSSTSIPKEKKTVEQTLNKTEKKELKHPKGVESSNPNSKSATNFNDVEKGASKSSKSKRGSPVKKPDNEDKKLVNLDKLKSKLPKHHQKSTIIDSDSDDSVVIEATPDSTSKSKKRKLQVISSDSENDDVNLKSSNKTSSPKISKEKKQKVVDNLKPVNILDVFSNTVQQSKVCVSEKKASEKIEKTATSRKKKKKNTELGVHDDKDFEKTLIDLDDDDIFLQNEDILDETIKHATEVSTEGENKLKELKDISENNLEVSKNSELPTENITTPKSKRSSVKRPFESESKKDETPTSLKKSKLAHTDSGVDDQERFEKKRFCAMQYQQYLNRSGPKNHGCKKLPEGKPDCLANLCFMRTGVLDSLESEEFENLIKQHGGRVVQAVSKKVNYVVVGDEPGPAKLQKAESYGIPRISEDELLDMILEKSGMPKKYTKKCDSGTVSSFEDAGIDDSFISSENDDTKTSKTETAREDITVIQNTKKSPSKKHEKMDCSTEVENQKSEKCSEINRDKMKISKSSSPDKKELIDAQSTEFVGLSEKYRPKELKQIIGQQLNNSNMNRLKWWLQNWYISEKSRKAKKVNQPKPWDKTNDGSYYRCALLSGPPGVGKTTTARLVSESLEFDIVEFNASDTRSKKQLQQEVAVALNSKNISVSSSSSALNKKRVILMDEVDGMAGNEDRGGMQELIALIKTSKIPIICMCNDRNHQKMRTLANYCFDLRFEKPKPQQILGFVMSICCKEGIKLSPQAAMEIINGTTCDIRQTLNQVSMIANLDSELSVEQAQKDAAAAKKDTILGPWQVCRTVFSHSEHEKMSIIDKSRLFFYDYSMGPLFVQENYLKVQPKVDRKKVMKHVSAAAAAISMGATIDKKIRESNNWSLLDMQSIYSSVLPGYYMSGNVTAVDFPAWLGKNSKRNKLKRMNNELAMHTKIQTSGGALAMNLDYSKALLKSIVTPLKKKGSDGVRDAVEVMKSYQLLREDLDNLVELCTLPKQKSLMDGIDSKVKAAFTKLYNKEVPIFSYSAGTGVSKKKGVSIYDDDQMEEGDDEENSEVEDSVENDSLIKTKTKIKTSNKKDLSKPSTSKQDAKPRGKKKK